MNFAMKWLAGALVTLALLVGFDDAVAAEPPAANATAVADPATWGVYAQLPGTEWNNGNARWLWGPDNTIVESRTFQMKSVIRPGANRGELVSVYGGGLHTFDGRIAADGSVLWVRRGRFLKMSSRVSIVDGELIEEMVKLDDAGQVAKVGSVLRFQQTAGPMVAAVAVAPVVASSGEPAQALTASPVPAPPAAASTAATADPVSDLQESRVETALAPAPPASASAHLERLKPMLGMMFLGGNQTIEFPAGADADSFALRYGNYLDANTTTFTYRTSGQPGVYVVTRQPADPYFTNFTGTVQADGTLVMSFQPINPDGYTYAYRYQTKGTGLLETRLALKKKWLSSEPEVTTQALNDYLPYSPAQYKVQADWLVMERQIMGTPEEQAAQRAREARQAKIESDQTLGRAFNNMLGDLSDHAQREAQTRADADAMLAQINAQAEAQRQAQAEAQRRAQQQAAEQQRQQLAENARWVAEKEQAAAEYRSGQAEAAANREAQVRAANAKATDQVRQAQIPSASDNPARPNANPEAQPRPIATGANQAGTLSVEPTQNAPVASSQPTTAGSRQELVACFVVKGGGFDQHNGAVFFSEIGPVTIANGRRQGDPENTFRAKVNAAYNVTGMAGCTTSTDSAQLQSYMEEVAGSYRGYKKVNTGMRAVD